MRTCTRTRTHAHTHAHPCACACTCTCYNSLQAKAVTKLRTFADACAHPSAKRITVDGRTGPVNAAEANGALFIENDESKAKAEAKEIRSKAMEPASKVTVASKAAVTTGAATEVAVPAPAPELAVATAALDPEPCYAGALPAVIKSNSYAAAVSKPSVRPKLSTVAYQLSADVKRSTAASKPAAAVLTPLEVNM